MIAGNTPRFDETWQQPSHASMRFKRLDSLPPVVLLDYEIQALQNAYRLVFLTGGEGTSGLGLGFIKRGPPSATDCSNPQDYRVQLSIPPVVRTSDMPDRICSKISDRAGNIAEPAVSDFGAPAMLPNAVGNAASRVRGRVAPGCNFRVDTFNLTPAIEFSYTPVPSLAGVRMWVLDAGGHTIPVQMTHAGPMFVEAVMPDAAAPGPAVVLVQPPEGSRISQQVTIGRTAPGIYPATGIATPSGFVSGIGGELFPLATCQSNSQGCYTTRLPLVIHKGRPRLRRIRDRPSECKRKRQVANRHAHSEFGRGPPSPADRRCGRTTFPPRVRFPSAVVSNHRSRDPGRNFQLPVDLPGIAMWSKCSSRRGACGGL